MCRFTNDSTPFKFLNGKIWPKGSLEEQVQNLVKTWEMEMFHKVNPQDFKAVDVTKLTVSVNGKLTSDTLMQIGVHIMVTFDL